jgi:ureidoglycolate lyase|tara:strand:- start:416 stop:910 length:495 start_codon:yes stop_codon:yes gene_type:complete
MEKIIKPIDISRANFKEFGDLISINDIDPININDGYAKRFDNLADVDTLSEGGKTTISIFSALKRAFPLKINMMEKHPLGSQAFVPMKETTFLCFVAPAGEIPEINKIRSFIIPPKMGINYKPGIWHFPLITTEDTNFLVVDRIGDGENLIIHKFKEKNIILEH